MAIINILGIPHSYNLTQPRTATPTLVFLHGWLLSREYWQPLIERLQSSYQCLSYDLRGFGESQKGLTPPGKEEERTYPVLGYTPGDYAADLALLLEALGLERVWLIGHSLGGSVALWAASQCPERVEGVIGLNSGGGIYLKEEFERFRTAGMQLVKWRPRWLAQMPGLDWLLSRSQVAQPLSRAWGRQRLLDFVRADYEAALGSLLDSTTEAQVHQLPQLVARLRQRVYFIAGAEDEVMEPRYVRHLASFHYLFRSGCNNVVEIPGCGHLSMLECTEMVASQIEVMVRGEGYDDRLATLAS